jgi:hypothetical protein
VHWCNICNRSVIFCYGLVCSCYATITTDVLLTCVMYMRVCDVCAVQDKTIKKYNKVVGVSFGASILLFIAMTAFPFLTFGANCKG